MVRNILRSIHNPRLSAKLAAALVLTRAGAWTPALVRWQNLLAWRPDNLTLAGLAKLNISVARRMLNLDAFREQVADYRSARAGRRPAAEPHAPKIAIFTAISGGYDALNLPERLDSRIDYIVFTDTPIPDTGIWQARPVTYILDDPTRTARFVKTHPHWLLAEYDVAVWIDANIMIVGDIYPLVERFISSGLPVGAVPHPIRKSVHEEADACVRYNKDQRAVLSEQAGRYRATGFDCTDLIESNLMMFNLRDERVPAFLDTWWAEIDRYSKRDQLSINYALRKAGIDWHRLTEHPDSARNHPALALVPHSYGAGPATILLEALQAPDIDPYAAPSYSSVREARIAGHSGRRIDIIVCVHNAYEDVRICLESIGRNRKSNNQRIVIVDDGSAALTADYLRAFARSEPGVELIRNSDAAGYTRSANIGLSASTGDLAILLNSDTVVTDGWAEKLADAVFSTPGAGIVGPMSNAASHQSIPEHRSSSRGQTAINPLPRGLTPDDMNRLCEEWTKEELLPRVPLVHGFCFGITRSALQKVGLFDEASFPRGYGEENDYCFRATDAGFGMVIATHTFVYHAKSKSFSGEDRIALMKAGSDQLIRLHGLARKTRAVGTMESNPFLVRMREHATALYT